MEATRDEVREATGRWLTASSPEHRERSVARATRFVSLVLVAVALIGLTSTIVQWIRGSSPVGVYAAILGALAAIALAYALTRTNNVRAAGIVAASVPTFGGLAVLIADPTDPGWFAFMALNPLLGRLFLPLRLSAPLAVANFGAVVVAVVAVSGIDDATAIVAVVFNGVVLALFLAGAVYHEATERERRRVDEERLRLAEIILEGTFGGVAILRRDEVVEANATFLAQFRPGDAGVIGEPITRFFGPASSTVIDTVSDNAESRPVDVEATRLDGSTFDAEVLVRRTFVDGDDAVVLAVRDITERKLADAAVRRAERTESIARLAAVMAHDTNNELTVIMGLSDRVGRQHAAEPDLTQSAGQIAAAADRAATLMRRVLLFDRVQEGASDTVDVAQFMSDNAPIWGHVLGPGVELRVKPPDGSAFAQIDVYKLAQVVLNLVLNARDAMDASGLVEIVAWTVEIGEQAGAPGVEVPLGRYQRVVVRDTGTGIAEEHLPRVFDAFYTTKDDGAGAGLGLYAARETLREAGGEITIDTSEDGTTVNLYLPEVHASAGGDRPSVDGIPDRRPAAQVGSVAARSVASRSVTTRPPRGR